MAEDRLDGLFMNLAQQSQGIEPLLDNFFSFLRRKSDFFSGADKKKIEETVLTVLRKHSTLAETEQLKKKAALEKEERLKKERVEKKKREEEAKRKAEEAVSKKKEEDDVLELSEDGSFDISTAKSTSSSSSESLPPPPSSHDDVSSEISNEKTISSGESNEEDKVIDEEEDKTPPPPGNGGKTDKYVWTQTLSEVTVSITLPKGTKSKILDVDIRNTRLKVGIKGQTPIIDGEFHKRVIVDDSLWTIDDGELTVTLAKDNRMEWWKTVIVGDPEINTQKVQPENSKLGDLDGETRQTVEKMMFDQRQKAMGLPSADEMQKQDMMKKFMSAHPEMDFSNAKFS